MERPKPSIGFVFADRYSVVENAFARRADRDLGYRTIRIDFAAEIEPTTLLVEQHRKGLLTMFAIPGDFTYNYHESYALERIRSAVGQDVPVYVLDYGHTGDEIVDLGNNTFGANPNSPVFMDKLIQARDQNPGVLQALRKNAVPQMEALLAAHQQNFPDSPAGDNLRVLLAFLRWDHLSPVEVVAEEFDPYIPEEKPLERIPNDKFSREVRKIRNLTAEQRDTLFQECSVDFRPRGFAIDPETLAYETTARFGKHGIAAIILEGQLQPLYRYGERPNLREEIIKGIIATSTSNFDTPIVLISPKWSDPDIIDKLRRVGRHLLREKMFIPVDVYMNLIDENYTPEIHPLG